MKKKTILFYVFEGFADWEASYATVGIALSDAYVLRTIALQKEPVRSMGGLSLLPDLDFIPEVDLCDVDASSVAMLILPGGSAWERCANDGIAPLVAHCIREGIPVAAICGATILLADHGMLNDVEHTSNDLSYLRTLSPSYEGTMFYLYRPCVVDAGLITAGGTASVEFASRIFEALDIGENEALRQWFRYFLATETVDQH